MGPYSLLRYLLLCLLLVGLSSPPGSVYASVTEPDTLVIGKISRNPKKHYRYLKPMARYAVEKMHDLGIVHSKVLMAKNKEQLADLVRRGEIDWVTETPFMAAYLHEFAGAEILVRKWKKGVPDYYTVFFARKESGVGELSDLRGKVIAFEDPASTSAFYYPAYVILRSGLKLIYLDNIRDKPPADSVGFVFAREEINIATLVHKGIVDAGVFSNNDWNKEDHLPTRYRKDFSVFHRTPKLIRALEIIRKDLDPAVKQRLERVLLEADRDNGAGGVLRAYQRTKHFDKLSKEQEEEVYQLRDVMRFVDKTLFQQ
jgi:phosphonate transport system substrate-binding protein